MNYPKKNPTHWNKYEKRAGNDGLAALFFGALALVGYGIYLLLKLIGIVH
jgi:hypothetical protein